jgi:hypothetical protein
MVRKELPALTKVYNEETKKEAAKSNHRKGAREKSQINETVAPPSWRLSRRHVAGASTRELRGEDALEQTGFQKFSFVNVSVLRGEGLLPAAGTAEDIRKSLLHTPFSAWVPGQRTIK